jgi:hypothetical protein
VAPGRAQVIRRFIVKKLLAAPIVALALVAPAALAAAHFVKVSPGTVKRGNKVTVSGNVGGGCEVGHTGDSAEIYSNAFKYTEPKGVGDLPTADAPLDKHGAFSIKVKISTKIKKGTYRVGGRCGGGSFGSATLKVT